MHLHLLFIRSETAETSQERTNADRIPTQDQYDDHTVTVVF